MPLETTVLNVNVRLFMIIFHCRHSILTAERVGGGGSNAEGVGGGGVGGGGGGGKGGMGGEGEMGGRDGGGERDEGGVCLWLCVTCTSSG